MLCKPLNRLEQSSPIGYKHGLGRTAGPVPDLIIAAQAELADLTMLHYDADFDLISSVTGQPTLWIIPQGSID